jgi:hypothetical protein
MTWGYYARARRGARENFRHEAIEVRLKPDATSVVVSGFSRTMKSAALVQNWLAALKK